MKRVLIPVADGSEEIEAVCMIDVLRRAGAQVTVASAGPDITITASRGVRIVADRMLEECEGDPWDLIALPGGMPGAEHLRDHPVLTRMLKEQQANDKLYAAICAAPAVVFQHHQLLGDRQATAHPAFSDRLSNQEAVGARIVADGQCITSRGPGTAIEFALKLVEMLFGPEKAQDVGAPMVLP